jgi:zinc transport system substrate-binding protein
MKKNILISVCALLLILGVFLLIRQPETPHTAHLKVVTTLFPLYDMAKNIGGADADVTLLLPPGMEAHSFEPKPSDMLKIAGADIFIYTGKFMEPWAHDITQTLSGTRPIVVDASRGTHMIAGTVHDPDEPAGTMDPHIWLDFDNAKIMAQNIADAFIAADDTNAGAFRQAAGRYTDALAALDTGFRTTLATCKTKEIVYGGHSAFGYLANRYGLHFVAAQGVAPDAEPTARGLAGLIDQIREHHIQYIFFEELSSPKVAETIAEETKVTLLPLNAAHNLSKDQWDRGVSFFDILNTDLENLKKGLACS